MFGATNDHGFVAIWDVVKRKNHLFIAKNHSSIASGIALSPINTNFFVSVGYDHLICMCDLRTKQSVCNRESPYALTSVDMSSDGIMMMCGHRKGGILIYDLRNNKEPLLNLSEHTGVVSSVAFQHAVRDNNKEKGHETSIEQNLSSDNISIEKVSTSDEQQDDSFLNLLDDMKENTYVSPNILQTPAKCEIDTFMNDLTSPKVSEPDLLLKNLTPKECRNLKSPNINSNEYLSPLPSINYETASRNEIFKSTPIPEELKKEEAKEYLNCEVNNADYLVLKNEVEDMKKHMMQMIEMHKSSMLRLHMLLCTQHIELMNKLDSGSITTDTMQLKKEIKRLQDENEILSYENGIMRSERDKYLSEPISSNGIDD